MSFSEYETIDFDERDINPNTPLSEHEKFLSFHEISSEEYESLPNNEQVRMRWIYKRLKESTND